MKPLDEALRETSAAAFDRFLTHEEQGPLPSFEYPTHLEKDALLTALRALDAAGWPVVSQEILTAIRMQVVALTAGSCSCGMKTPNAALHPADCRYAQLANVLDNLDALAAAPKLPTEGGGE